MKEVLKTLKFKILVKIRLVFKGLFCTAAVFPP